MSRYTQRVCDSILPLSVGDTLPKAFEEWYFTEEVVDHELPSETCQLCGQEELGSVRGRGGNSLTAAV